MPDNEIDRSNIAQRPDRTEARLPASFQRIGEDADNVERSIILRVPASSANLGPAFDTMGIALKLYTWLDFVLLRKDNPSVSYVTTSGVIAQELPTDRSNLIFQVLRQCWSEFPNLVERTRVSIYSDIPLARGLGSSSCAIAGAVYASHILRGNKISQDNRRVRQAALGARLEQQAATTLLMQILAECAPFEGHLDNLAPCLLGGLVIARYDSNSGEVVTTSIPWPEKWRAILVVPPYELGTEIARSVLPASLPKSDVIENLQRVALLTTAIHKADDGLLSEALHDKIHERYREKLVPELPEIRSLLKGSPALGCVLSGAGSSVLVLVHEKDKSDLLKLLQDWSTQKSPGISIMDLEIDVEGLVRIDVQ
jgi:homoserine kinase